MQHPHPGTPKPKVPQAQTAPSTPEHLIRWLGEVCSYYAERSGIARPIATRFQSRLFGGFIFKPLGLDCGFTGFFTASGVQGGAVELQGFGH